MSAWNSSTAAGRGQPTRCMLAMRAGDVLQQPRWCSVVFALSAQLLLQHANRHRDADGMSKRHIYIWLIGGDQCGAVRAGAATAQPPTTSIAAP